MTWLVIAALIYLAPAILHGGSLGPFDTLGQWGLGKNIGQPTTSFTLDQILQMAPWTALDWMQVHSGHLPLWNPYSALGMPLAFNFQSAPFALPTVIGYLVPLRFAYTTAVFAKMVIGGTGVFYLGRKLGLSNLSSVLAGTIFELSGSFTGWLGWPQATVICFLGWILGATISIVDRPHDKSRASAVTLLALFLACAVYGGHPESLIFVVECVSVVTLIYLFARVRRTPGKLWRALAPGFDVLVAGIASVALAAPLLLPGIPILSHSIRQLNEGFGGVPKVYLVNLVAPGYFGFPVSGYPWYGSFAYYEVASYVGGIAVILALFALFSRWRNRAALAFTAIAVVMLATLFLTPFSRFLGDLPFLKSVLWTRTTMPLDLALAALAGMGLESLRRDGRSSAALMRLGAADLIFAVALGIAWFSRATGRTVPASHRSAETHAFVAPLISIATVAVIIALLWVLQSGSVASIGSRRLKFQHFGPEIACVTLFVAQAVLLLTATPNLWASSSQFFAASQAERTLAATIGSSRLGEGSCMSINGLPADIGLWPDANVVYGISELAAYDPAVPQADYDSWSALTKTPVVHPRHGWFCPTMNSAAVARHYGVSYVIEPPAAQLSDLGAQSYPLKILYGQYGPSDYIQIGTAENGQYQGTNVIGGAPVYANGFGGFVQDFYMNTLRNGTGIYIPRSLTAYEATSGNQVAGSTSAPPASAQSHPPAGMQFVKLVGNEPLYRVPGGAIATLERRGEPQDSPTAQQIHLATPSPSKMELRTSANYPSSLYIHVGTYSGWHLTVDGKPWPLHRWAGVMMEVDLPPGAHVIQLTYLPSGFLYGIALAVVTVLGLVIWIFIERRRRSGVKTAVVGPARSKTDDTNQEALDKVLV